MSLRHTAELAVREVAGEHLGDFLGIEPADGVSIARFASTHPGYPHWHWSVVLVGDDDAATVSEVWMEPGEGALQIPAWKPWSERVRPGDLGAGDVYATDPNDPRLTAGLTGLDDLDAYTEPLQPVQWTIGLGRERILSAEGLTEAAERWRAGEDGPDSQIARQADFPCSTCGWLLTIGGPLGQAFGVCAHDMSPSDGHVVALDHGCGAHSQIRVEASPLPVAELIIDDEREFVLVDRGQAEPEVVEEPSAESAVESPAPTDDVDAAEDADRNPGIGDITPPEDVPLAE